MTKLETLKIKHAELQAQIVEESKAFFKEESAALFAKYPAMESFAWRQYTPYWNDGEECTFSVHSDGEINGADSYENKKTEAKIPEAAYGDIRKHIDAIDSDTMKTMFGDHVKVICKRDGIEIEEYSHD